MGSPRETADAPTFIRSIGIYGPIKRDVGDAIPRDQLNGGGAFDRLAAHNWQQLRLATHCFEVTQLGYLGCDIVLDEQRDPLLLEMNELIGLGIKIATNDRLLARLQHIEKLETFARSMEDRVACAMQTCTRTNTVEQQSLWEES